MATRKVFAELLQAVVEHFNPRKVILFGSQARGRSRQDNEHDLLAIVDHDIPPMRPLQRLAKPPTRSCWSSSSVF